MGYKEKVESYRSMAKRWEQGEQLLLSGELRIQDTLREAANIIETLLAAFLAQQAPIKLDRSRWEGYDYCNDPSPHRDCVLPDGTEQFLCSRDGFFGDCYINERRIHFCPMCGRPLTEEAWAELERRLAKNEP